MNTLTNLIEIVLEQSHMAYDKDEIPIGAVIFDPMSNKLVAKAHNRELSNNDPTAHAEILCIRKACKKLNQKRLDNLELITYLEPCDMCKEVIKSARIKRVYYLLTNNNPKRKTITKAKYKHIDLKEQNIIKKFFQKKRTNN